MRNRHRRALYGLTAAVAVSTTLGLTPAGAATTTNGAKPSIIQACTLNSYCSDPLFNVEFGIQYFVNNANSLAVPGNNIDLQWANDSKPSQDWRVSLQYPVYVLYHLGLIGAGMELDYHFRPAFEVMWTPDGVISNLCRGVAEPAFTGELVTLQPCGNFPETLWVVKNDYSAVTHVNDSTPAYGGNALINGSTANPTVPQVLTAGGGLWGGNPEAQLQVDPLAADDGLPNEAQLWCTATETLRGSATPKVSSSVGRPTIGPPTFRANAPNCFPNVRIGGIGGGKV
jgi:hypothetical protein